MQSCTSHLPILKEGKLDAVGDIASGKNPKGSIKKMTDSVKKVVMKDGQKFANS